LKLVGAVTQGSGAVNEDGLGYLGTAGDISAAWVMDGVTGINGRSYLPAGSDAAWLVGKAHQHLEVFAAFDIPMAEIVSRLVNALIDDWQKVTKGLNLPENFDPPAACLVLAKRYGQAWQAVRLGDSCLLARSAIAGSISFPASPNNSFDLWLKEESARRREAGSLDIKSLLVEFQPQLAAARKSRNMPSGYSILEAHPRTIEFAEYLELGSPVDVLLCTDGYYRAVDHYSQYSDEELLAACARSGGVDHILQGIRAVEKADPNCQVYLRFKPADDATALMLSSN
jgi:Protein phosphatase 2C